MRLSLIVTIVVLVLPPKSGRAQQHDHRPGMTHPAPSSSTAVPGAPGQAAFGVIAEAVRALSADPGTDWSRVDIEALRRHLHDMEAVVMRARVRSEPVAGGMRFIVTGPDAATAAAIRRMLRAHGPTLDVEAGYQATLVDLPTGARWTVVAPAGAPPAVAHRIRTLGPIGLLTLGDHHAAHHLALARGVAPHGH